MIKYPNKINEIKLGITSISDGANEKMNTVLDYLDKNKVPLKCSPYLFDSASEVCGTPQERAEDFLKLWNDKDVNYILSSFGGEFGMEILPILMQHKEVFSENKKWFQGFSDASLLAYFLTTNFNLATINCYNAEDYGTKEDLLKLRRTLERVKELKKNYRFYQFSSDFHLEDYSRDVEDELVYDKTEPKCSQEQLEIEGVLIGGWIEAISEICGTKYDNTKNFCKQFDEGVIWYIDNCELTSPMLRRRLWQMREADYFKNCNGVLIGRQPFDEFDGDYDYQKAISDTFDDLKIPVIEDVDVGHFFPQWMMINGSNAKVTYDRGKVKILERLQ